MVAWFALAVSCFALSWQFYYAVRVDRAAITVRAEYYPTWTAGDEGGQLFLVVTVTNIGRRATVLQSVFVARGKRRRRMRDYDPNRFRKEHYPVLIAAPEAVQDRQQPTLPCRLDVGDEVSVYFDEDIIRRTAGAGDVPWIHGYARASTARDRSTRPIPVLSMRHD